MATFRKNSGLKTFSFNLAEAEPHFRVCRLGSTALLSALLCTTGAISALAQTVTSPVIVNETVSAAADISLTPLPTAGVAGQNGRGGYYTCNQMTWGAACADFYSFGSYDRPGATNGQNAPSGGTVTTVA